RPAAWRAGQHRIGRTARIGAVRAVDGLRRHHEPDRGAATGDVHDRIHRPQGVPARRGGRGVNTRLAETKSPRPPVVAAAQAESVAGDIAANARTTAAYVRAAADNGARLLLLPELFLSGYDMRTIGERPDDCDLPAEALDDVRLEPLRSAAAESGVLTLVGAS